MPPVEANEGRLGQVFLNLIVNATQAITEGRADQNEIWITTRQTDCLAVYAPRLFGCERPMNRATDLDGLFAAITERSRTCRACSYRCNNDEPNVFCDEGLCTSRAKGGNQ